jgi:hypothetical protein
MKTTRPLAEGTLFSLLHAAVIKETEGGFVLDEDRNEEPEEHFGKIKRGLNKNRARFRSNTLHSKRITMRHSKHVNHSIKLDGTDVASGMLTTEQTDAALTDDESST